MPSVSRTWRRSLDLALNFACFLLLRAVAAARHHQRERPPGMAEAEMQSGEAAHRQTDDVRLVELQMIEDGQDVVGSTGLAVARRFLRHVGRRIAARAPGDAAVALAEMAHLRFPRAVVGGVFMHEHDRCARARLLVVELHAIVGGGIWHRFSPVCREFRSYGGAPPNDTLPP
jgi:hypothetical protein